MAFVVSSVRPLLKWYLHLIEHVVDFPTVFLVFVMGRQQNKIKPIRFEENAEKRGFSRNFYFNL